MFLLFYRSFFTVHPFDDAAGIAHRYTIGRDVAGHYASGTDDGAVANGHSGTDGGMAAYPAALANAYGATGFPLVALVSINGMPGGKDVDTGGYQGLAADVHASPVENGATEVDKYAFAGKDEVSVVAIERWLNIDIGS